MHSAMFVATIPDLEKGNWDAFLADIFSKLRTAKGVERLAEMVASGVRQRAHFVGLVGGIR